MEPLKSEFQRRVSSSMMLPDEINRCVLRHQAELACVLQTWTSRNEQQMAAALARLSNMSSTASPEATLLEESDFSAKDSALLPGLPASMGSVGPFIVGRPLTPSVTSMALEPTEQAQCKRSSEKNNGIKNALKYDYDIESPTLSDDEDVGLHYWDMSSVSRNWHDLCRKLLSTMQGLRKIYIHDRWKIRVITGSEDNLEDFGSYVDDVDADDFLSDTLTTGELLRIHPGSRFRIFWVLLSLLMCAVDFITVPIEISQSLPETDAMLILQWIGLIFWTTDLCLNFITGVYSQEKLHMDLKSISKDYTTSWFLLDFPIVLVEWFSAVASSWITLDASAVSILKVLRTVRLVKLLRIRKLIVLLRDTMLHYMAAFGTLLFIVRLCLEYLCALHIVGCFWFWYRTNLSTKSEFLAQFGLESGDVIERYFMAYGQAESLLVGGELGVLLGNEELVMATTLRFLGFLAMAVFVARIVFVVQLTLQSEMRHLQEACSSYLLTNNIGAALAKTTTRSLDLEQAAAFLNRRLSTETKFLRSLPKLLQVDLCEETFGHMLLQRNFFLEFFGRYRTVFRHLCSEAITERVAKRHDTIFQVGHAGLNMYFIRSGHVDYNLSHTHGLAMSRSMESLLATSLGALNGPVSIEVGEALSEACLWTHWFHTGRLHAERHSIVAELNAEKFGSILSVHKKSYWTAVCYARKFSHDVESRSNTVTDISKFQVDFGDLEDYRPDDDNSGEHFVFLSHFKAEAGTEAVLLQEAMTKLITEDRGHSAHSFKDPVFLDSDTLVDLTKLSDHLQRTHNLVLLLTPGLLTRPWCLVEIVTAFRLGIKVVPVEIQRPGLSKFGYPDAEFYSKFRAGKTLNDGDRLVLESENVTLKDCEEAIRNVFTKIALTFSPHKSYAIRRTEICRVMERCQLMHDQNTQNGKAQGTFSHMSRENLRGEPSKAPRARRQSSFF